MREAAADIRLAAGWLRQWASVQIAEEAQKEPDQRRRSYSNRKRPTYGAAMDDATVGLLAVLAVIAAACLLVMLLPRPRRRR